MKGFKESVNHVRKSLPMRGNRLPVLLLVFLLVVLGSAPVSWALQRNTLVPQEGGQSEQHQVAAPQARQSASQGHEVKAPPTSEHTEAPSAPSQGAHQPATPPTPTPAPLSPTPSPLHEGEAKQLPQAEHAPVHGTPGEHQEGEHVQLPEISPTPGVTFVETMINLLDYEVNKRFLRWRPNDLIIGRFFTDNINNYQLGVLETMRFTTQALKVNLTRMGDADAYDKNLEHALNSLMNRSTSYWFPSAESSYNDTIEGLQLFLNDLKSGKRTFYYRVDNLLTLCTYYKDFLGNVNKGLIISSYADGTPIGWSKCDDQFYYAKGIAHVMYEILRVVRVGFKTQIVTLDALDIMDEILHELHRVEKMEPWIIMDSGLDGFFANHRANLNAPLSEVAHMLGVVVQLGNQIRY